MQLQKQEMISVNEILHTCVYLSKSISSGYRVLQVFKMNTSMSYNSAKQVLGGRYSIFLASPFEYF